MDQLAFMTHKQRGEFFELYFALCAYQHGLIFAKPWGETAPFDCVLVDGRQLSRVQVKTTMSKRASGYSCFVAANHQGRYVRYGPEEIDFMAAYVIPEDAWFILPVEVAGRLASQIGLNPKDPASKYYRYLEAWDLLKAPGEGPRPEPPQPADRPENARLHRRRPKSSAGAPPYPGFG